MYGLQYGTLPLVRATGGLADTVTNCTSETIEASTATGFVFQKAEADDLRSAIQHAFALWQKQRVWARIRNNAMAQDFSWKNAATQYEQLYLGILNA